jgi:drug/metabolite transporter (DMT)-like permease
MVATRYVVADAGPASLALLRYVVGFLCLVPALLAARPLPRFAPRDLLPIALLGAMQFGLLIALLNFGMRTVTAGRAALLFATFPLMTMALAALLGHERLTARKLVGILLTIAGVALALGEKLAATKASESWLGEAAILGSAFCGALCSVLYRPYLKRYPALPTGALAMLASVVFLAVLAAGEGFFAAPPAFTMKGWLAILFIGASSGIGYFLWLWALRHTAATNVTIFLALSPITAALLGALLLGEALSAAALGGLVAVLLGLVVALMPARV